MLGCVSHKSAKIAQRIQACQGKDMDAHYLGFFECFNTGYYYEAHDVLEELWLSCRKEPRGDFYKGLIQLAGAFVHLKHNRLRPAAALFKLSRGYVQRFGPVQERLHVPTVLVLIQQWLDWLESSGFSTNPLTTQPAPNLRLLSSD